MSYEAGVVVGLALALAPLTVMYGIATGLTPHSRPKPGPWKSIDVCHDCGFKNDIGSPLWVCVVQRSTGDQNPPCPCCGGRAWAVGVVARRTHDGWEIHPVAT